MVSYASKIPKESYIEVHAKVVVPESAIASTTQEVELDVFKIHTISSAPPELPFQMEDASRKETVVHMNRPAPCILRVIYLERCLLRPWLG